MTGHDRCHCRRIDRCPAGAEPEIEPHKTRTCLRCPKGFLRQQVSHKEAGLAGRLCMEEKERREGREEGENRGKGDKEGS